MAIRLIDQYPTRATPADASYPNGSFKNVTTPGAGDGTPLQKIWADDWLGGREALFAAAGVVPNGSADTAVASQWFDALTTYINERVNAVAGIQIGKINFRILDTVNLTALAPNELVCAGQELLRANYTELWDYINASGSVVNDTLWNTAGYEGFYSSGDGSTTFRPPNLATGVFPRMLDLATLYDPDRATRTGGNVAGSNQGDAIRNITGSFNPGGNFVAGSGTGTFTTGAVRSSNTGAASDSREVIFDASTVVPTGGDNRPTNVALVPTITYRTQ